MAARPRVLIAPITVTPTKPLTPTHLSFLLAIDVMRRATAVLRDVTCVYHHRTYATTWQTLAFWAYLDATRPGTDYSSMGEEQIGSLYVDSDRSPVELDFASLQPYLHRVEQEGWLHPASRRLIELWERHYRLLGLADPTMGQHGPALLPVPEVLEILARHGLCLDARPMNGPVYLDATASGMPLRVLVSPEGHANYLVCLLRELIPLTGRHDLVVLAYDRDLRADYLLVEQVLGRLGVPVRRFEVNRVPIDGAARSSRYGGWAGYCLPDVRRRAGHDLAAFRLGLRLYLIAVLGKGGDQSFRYDLLRRWVRRAQAMLADPPSHGPDLAGFLQPLMPNGYVDPYRLCTTYLRRRGAGGAPDLTGTVFAARTG